MSPDDQSIIDTLMLQEPDFSSIEATPAGAYTIMRLMAGLAKDTASGEPFSKTLTTIIESKGGSMQIGSTLLINDAKVIALLERLAYMNKGTAVLERGMVEGLEPMFGGKNILTVKLVEDDETAETAGTAFKYEREIVNNLIDKNNRISAFEFIERLEGIITNFLQSNGGLIFNTYELASQVSSMGIGVTLFGRSLTSEEIDTLRELVDSEQWYYIKNKIPIPEGIKGLKAIAGKRDTLVGRLIEDALTIGSGSICDLYKELYARNITEMTKEVNINYLVETALDEFKESVHQETIKQIIPRAFVLLQAGFDTTGHSISTILSYLWEHNDSVAKLREKLVALYKQDPDKLWENIASGSVKELDEIINRALTIAPPVIATVRKFIMNDEEQTLVYNISGMYQNAINRGFNDPAFVERVFAHGTRVCLGKGFALREIRLVLGYLLLNFNFNDESQLGDLTAFGTLSQSVVSDLVMKPIE